MKGSSIYLILSRATFIAFFFVLSTEFVSAQSGYSKFQFVPQNFSIVNDAQKVTEVYPSPSAVLRRSLIIPGWGQITNKQAWKVPIVYSMLGGLAYYSTVLTRDYHDYRAAYYNATSGSLDLKFGATPAYLDGLNVNSLRSQRDFLRNRRDFIYVTIGLAYILNVVDAYVFAHLRPFDVSDDLSFNTRVKSNNIENAILGDVPSLTLSISITR